MSKKTAVLDLTGCKYVDEMHLRIKDALNFPEHYGKNFDAFWDCINRDCDIDFVTVVGYENMADNIKPSARKILDMLEENKQYWADSSTPFDYEVIN